MKKYANVSELEDELVATGFIKDSDITIPANADGGCMTDNSGNQIIYFDAYKSYYIILANAAN